MFWVQCLLSLWQQDKGFGSVLPLPGKTLPQYLLCKCPGICKPLFPSRPLGLFAEEEDGCRWNGNGAGDRRPWVLTCLASGEAPSDVKASGGSFALLLMPCPGLHLSVYEEVPGTLGSPPQGLF